MKINTKAESLFTVIKDRIVNDMVKKVLDEWAYETIEYDSSNFKAAVNKAFELTM